jgi:hypothetical protein
MRVRWLGVGQVAVLVVCTLLLKGRARQNAGFLTESGSPAIILVADLREANDLNDRCADIIRAVREASKRGVHVAELQADSHSDLLRRYHVLTVPVLLLDGSGKEIGRFEGEDSNTVKSVQTRLAALGGTKP